MRPQSNLNWWSKSSRSRGGFPRRTGLPSLASHILSYLLTAWWHTVSLCSHPVYEGHFCLFYSTWTAVFVLWFVFVPVFYSEISISIPSLLIQTASSFNPAVFQGNPVTLTPCSSPPSNTLPLLTASTSPCSEKPCARLSNHSIKSKFFSLFFFPTSKPLQSVLILASAYFSSSSPHILIPQKTAKAWASKAKVSCTEVAHRFYILRFKMPRVK